MMRTNALSFDWDTSDEDATRHNTRTLVRLLSRCKRGEDGLLYWAGPECNRYGQMSYGGAMQQAHRLAYALLVGPIPAGACVLHRNDEPYCLDPSVLFLGTQADNVHDMESKGRGQHPSGEDCGSAKLTRNQVNEMRVKYRPGRANKPTMQDLADEYGVSQSLVNAIINKQVWR